MRGAKRGVASTAGVLGGPERLLGLFVINLKPDTLLSGFSTFT